MYVCLLYCKLDLCHALTLLDRGFNSCAIHGAIFFYLLRNRPACTDCRYRDSALDRENSSASTNNRWVIVRCTSGIRIVG